MEEYNALNCLLFPPLATTTADLSVIVLLQSKRIMGQSGMFSAKYLHSKSASPSGSSAYTYLTRKTAKDVPLVDDYYNSLTARCGKLQKKTRFKKKKYQRNHANGQEKINLRKK